jgi:hypothetical protein
VQFHQLRQRELITLAGGAAVIGAGDERWWHRDAERALAVLRLMIKFRFRGLLSRAKLAKLSLIF